MLGSIKSLLACQVKDALIRSGPSCSDCRTFQRLPGLSYVLLPFPTDAAWLTVWTHADSLILCSSTVQNLLLRYVRSGIRSRRREAGKFFSGAGYDQGMMGGVNGALDYVTTMGLGYVTPGVDGGKPTATVTQSTKQVSRFLGNASCLVSLLRRS